jgi:hypothetical protein
MGHGTIDKLVVRTRTLCDHRRQLFQSLADANIEEDSGLDFDKEKRIAAQKVAELPEERLRLRIIMTMETRFTMLFLTFFLALSLALSLSKLMRLLSCGMPSVHLQRIIIIPRSAYAS